jgi:hypothetical protein
MATIDCDVRTCWNDAKRQRLAGMGCDEFYNITAVQDGRKECEKNEKYQLSHISSNGYYGYLPVMPDTDDYAMDTNDAGAENSMGNGTDPKNEPCISTLTNMQNINGNVLSVGISLGRRKRISGECNPTEKPKRRRKEGNLMHFLSNLVHLIQFTFRILLAVMGFP